MHDQQYCVYLPIMAKRGDWSQGWQLELVNYPDTAQTGLHVSRTTQHFVGVQHAQGNIMVHEFKDLTPQPTLVYKCTAYIPLFAACAGKTDNRMLSPLTVIPASFIRW